MHTIKPVDRELVLKVACEFSDWQAYYLAEYVAEFGGTPQFIMSNNHIWKNTRPMNGIRIPRGTWGLTLTEGMDGLGMNGSRVEYPGSYPYAFNYQSRDLPSPLWDDHGSKSNDWVINTAIRDQSIYPE